MNSTAKTSPVSGCPVPHGALSGGVGPTGCPVSNRAAAFDPFEGGFMQDPPDYVRWAREEEPLFYSPKIGYWVVTRFDSIKAIFRDNVTFSPSIALEKMTPTGEEVDRVLATYDYAMNRTLVNEDEPAHMPRRRLLLEPFTPEQLTEHEERVRQVARAYVDRFIDDGQADLVDQMLWEVPLIVALVFLGVSDEDMATLRTFSVAHTVNTWGRPKPEEQIAVAHAVGNFWQLAGKVLDRMREDPSQPGWMQYALRKQVDHPDVVTDSYLHSMMMAGIVAAHETTANASANAIKLLLERPQVWRELCEDPSLIPNAVEECLRHSGSMAAWRRLVMQDTRIDGIDIPAGSKLLIVLSSANHDERHFADADLFDIRRENASDHLTFGYGSHQCMGKNLARMEIQVILQELTRRLPHMRLRPQEFTYLPNISFRGPEHLWVEWDPARNPERTDPSVLEQVAPVRLGEPSRGAISRSVTVESATMVARDIVKLRLVSADGQPMPRWTPGSHIDVECGSPDTSRQYSLCGDPADTGALEIAILREPQGRGGSNWVHENVRPGMTLRIRGPRNHFRLDETVRKAVFIAGGIGITPIKAMAQRARELGIDYQLHYSGRARETMAFVRELALEHGERLHLYPGDEELRCDLASLLAGPAAGTQVYACGPERMLEALETCCAEWPEDTLRTEHFVSTAGVLDPSREHAFEAELRDSGIVVTVAADQTLLQALRRANIDVQSDCEEGLCGSCEVRVLEGEVDHRDVVLTKLERETNMKMMSCCSRASGQRLVIEL